MKQLTNNIDIQQCTARAGNKFDLILMAAVRAREIGRSNHTHDQTKHKHAILALEEIQQGIVGRELLRKVGRKFK